MNSRGQNFRWKVCDVRWDLFASEELSHLVAENVAVVLKHVVLVTPWHKEKKDERERNGTDIFQRKDREARQGGDGWASRKRQDRNILRDNRKNGEV